MKPLDSKIIDHCQDRYIKDYLNKVASKASRGGFEELSKEEVMEIERFMNLEVYFRNI